MLIMTASSFDLDGIPEEIEPSTSGTAPDSHSTQGPANKRLSATFVGGVVGARTAEGSQLTQKVGVTVFVLVVLVLSFLLYRRRHQGAKEAVDLWEGLDDASDEFKEDDASAVSRKYVSTIALKVCSLRTSTRRQPFAPPFCTAGNTPFPPVV
jgi:hypothetical protein